MTLPPEPDGERNKRRVGYEDADHSIQPADCDEHSDRK